MRVVIVGLAILALTFAQSEILEDNKLENILEKSEVVLPKNDSQQEQTDNGVDIESKTLGNHITGKLSILKVSIICKIF